MVTVDNATKSIVYFGVYMVVVGLIVVFFPNVLLSLFGLPTTSEVWLRLGGLLIAILGGYYLHAGRYRLVPFYRATIYGRIAFACGIAVFVFLGLASPILLIVGLIDIVSALFTARSLQKGK